jgi:hypothetical protein
LVDEISVSGGPHEIGKCCADLGRAGFLDKVPALAVSCVSRLDAPFSPKRLVLIFSGVSMKQM